MSQGTPRTISRGKTARRKAMEAAIEAVAELGADRVRMVDIASRAGMSTGHILYYFGNKDGLLLETLRWSEEDLIERMRAAMRRLRAPRRKLASFVDFYLPAGTADPRWTLWTQVIANPPGDEPSRLMLDSFDRAWEGQLAEIVADGIAKGEFAPVNVDEFVVCMRAMLDGLSLNLRMGSIRLTRETAIGFAVRMMNMDLGGPAPG